MKAQFTGDKLACSLFACLAALLLSASVAVAQSSGTAALTGTVTDLSGASLANVTVTATNIGTNQQRTMTTGPDGIYKFALLPPGNYRVQFSAQGFKTTEVPAVAIEVTETATVNRVLEVGTVTESVVVQGAGAEALQTESATVSSTVTGQSIISLPTATRNYTEILGLGTGTSGTPENAASFGSGTQDASVNGNQPTSNNFQMDGVSINSIAGDSDQSNANNGLAGIYPGIAVPNPDAVEEFKVQTSLYDASYGRNAGANVNLVTKSGTNNLHGVVFEYLRNSVLNADDYFYPKSSPGNPAHQTLNQNQFGFAVGGPIRKSKLFYFGSYQGTRSKNGVDPTIAEAFGINLPPIPAGPRSTDPTSTWARNLAAMNCPANHPGQPQFGSFISAPFVQQLACDGSNLNPSALALLNVKGPASSGGYYIPADNSPGCIPASGSLDGFTTCSFVVPVVRNEDQGVGSLDYMVNSKNTLAVRFFESLAAQPTYGDELPGYSNPGEYTNSNALLRLTTVFSSTLVNEARASYQRLTSHATDVLPSGDTPQNLGMATIESAGPDAVLPAPMVMIQGNTTLNGLLYPVWTAENQFEYGDQISWSHGAHTIRTGAEFERDEWNFTHDGIERGFVLIGNWDDLLVGQAGNIVQCIECIKAPTTGLTHWYRLSAVGAFVQDDWKVRPRLTLNLGLRWDVDGEVSDAHGNDTNIWPSLLATVANSQMPLNLTACGGAMCAASLVGNVVARNEVSRYGQPPPGVLMASNNAPLVSPAPLSNFAPRFGFSWQVFNSSKLVVRGGGGLFYDRLGIDDIVHALNSSNPYAANVQYGYPNGATLAQLYPTAAATPIPGWQGRYFDAACLTFGTCDYPTNYLFPGQPGSSYLTGEMLGSKWHTPLARQYNLGLESEFAPGWVLEVDYVGNTSINLQNALANLNVAQLIPENQSITLNGSGGPVVITTNTTANVTARVPYLGYAPTGVENTSFNGKSNYNGLQTSVKHQISHGLMVQASYTWSKSMSDIWGYAAGGNVATDVNSNYAVSAYNRPQRFTVDYNYDLPFGKGWTGAAGKLGSGWNVSGVTLAQSGDPILIIDSRLGGAYGTGSSSQATGYSFPQLCPGYTAANVVTHGAITSKLHDYFNVNAFNNPNGSNSSTCPLPLVANNGGDTSATDFGTLRPGAAYGPGAFYWDFALNKATKLKEGVTMQFRTEFYNAFNHPNFSDPVQGNGATGIQANVDTSTFGDITSSAVNPRLIQFALRFAF